MSSENREAGSDLGVAQSRFQKGEGTNTDLSAANRALQRIRGLFSRGELDMNEVKSGMEHGQKQEES